MHQNTNKLQMHAAKLLLRLLMKALSSIINVYATQLKLIFCRRSTLRYYSAVNFAMSTVCQSRFEGSFSAGNGFSLKENCNPSECREYNEVYYSGKDVIESVDFSSLFSSCQKRDDEEMKRIKSILAKSRLSLGCQNGYNMYWNQLNIIEILNYLFEESLDANLALYFFKWLECCTGSKHTVWTTCRMMHILVSGNMNHRAVDLILRLVRNHAEEESCNLLLEVIYETHSERSVLGTVCSMLVNNYIKEGMVNAAQKLTCQMKHWNIFPSIGVCNTLLKASLEINQLDFAWDFLEVMQTRKLGINASIMSLFIHKYCGERDLKSGLKLFFEMNKYGIRPDVVSYTIVIHSLCKMSYLNEATALLFKMTQLGIYPDSVLVSSVVDGHCKLRQTEKAFKILKIFSPAPNIFVYNSFISKLCADGNMLEASGLFLEMFGLGLIPDCFCYTTIIGGYCKVKNIKTAFQYFGKMLKSGIPPSVVTYTLLIDAYCKSGDIEMAEHLFQAMISEGLLPDIVTCNTLIDGFGKNGHLQKVFVVLHKMKSFNVSPDVVTYNTLIHSLVTRGYANEAKEMLFELIRRGFTLDVATFTNVIDGFSKKGNFGEAFLVWFHMDEHEVKPDVVTCSALLNGYCRKHRIEEASVLFRKMLDIGLTPDLILYNTMICGFCSVGNTDEACNLVCMMVENGILPNNVTRQALILGFERKWIRNPVLVATLKLQEVLHKYGIIADFDENITMRKQPGNQKASVLEHLEK